MLETHVTFAAYIGLALRTAARSSTREQRAAVREGTFVSRATDVAAVLDGVRRDLGSFAVSVVVNMANSSGKTALHHAAWAGDLDTARVLLHAGAAVDALSIRGQTALHQACAARPVSRDLVMLLLEHGAGAAFRDTQGNTPRLLAERNGFSKDVLLRLESAESTHGWVDFHTVTVSRTDRRLSMGHLGGLIFSSDEQERLIEGGEGSEESMAHVSCCALVVCTCRKGGSDSDKEEVGHRAETCMGVDGRPDRLKEAHHPAPIERLPLSRELLSPCLCAREWARRLDALAEHALGRRTGALSATTTQRLGDIVSNALSAIVTAASDMHGLDNSTELGVVLIAQALAEIGVGGSKSQVTRARLLRSALLQTAPAQNCTPPVSPLRSLETLCRFLMDRPSRYAIALVADVDAPRGGWAHESSARHRERVVTWLLGASTEDPHSQDIHGTVSLAVRATAAFDLCTHTPDAVHRLVSVLAGLGDLSLVKAAGELLEAHVNRGEMLHMVMEMGSGGKRTMSWVRKLQYLALSWDLPPPQLPEQHFRHLETEVLATLVKAHNWAAAAEYASGRPALEAALARIRLPPASVDDRTAQGRHDDDACDRDAACVHVLEPEFSVHWVDSMDGVVLLERAMVGASVVAIDAEWRDPRPCSTLQLALLPSKQAWVVCVLPNHGDPIYRARVGAVLANCLRDPCVTKVGFAFSRDLTRIQTVCPTLVGVVPARGTFFDLNTNLAGVLSTFNTAERTNTSDVSDMRVRALEVAGRSLATLTHAVFGLTLSKGPQVSDWDRRPLSSSQLIYAALDAEVLARLFTSLRGGGYRSL